MDEAKLGFFSRIKKAVFNFEEYEKFVVEKTSVGILYFVKLIILFAIIITIAFSYILKVNTQKFINILDNEFPNFYILDGILDIENTDKFDMYIDSFNIYVVLDKTLQNPVETDYMNNIQVLNNKIVVNFMGFIQEINYDEMDISKQTVIDYFNTHNLIQIILFTGAIVLVLTFITFFIIFILDIFLLTIVGLFFNMIIRLPFKIKEVFHISIYAMTLPVILYLIYSLLNILFGITISFFDIAYNTISCIYVITVLLIMKSDIIKNTQELQKILEEEKKVREELASKRQEEKDKQEEANREGKKEKEKKENKDKPEGEPQVEN